MLTSWLTFTAVLVSSANPERAAIGRGTLTVTPTCRVKGHLEAELTLNCGDGKNAGVVQYWHTPFGYYKTPGFHSKLDPVFMHHDGSLVVPNSSILHIGLYYCLLQHTEGSTLWPYQLHIGHDNPKNRDHSEHKQSDDAFRFRRDVESLKEQQGGVSDGVFAGAVAASVLLTFVLGFSAGALSRTHVLRCLGAITMKFRSSDQQQTDTSDRSSVTMITLPPIYDNQAFEMERVWDDADSANCGAMETTNSSSTSSPPAKPQRSFREKRQEEQETTAYLEGCDYRKEEQKAMEEEELVAGRSLEENDKECAGEAEEEEERQISGLYLSGEDGGRQTNEDECSEGEEERDEREEEVQEAGEQDNRSKEDGEERTEGEEKACGNREKGSEEKEEVDDGEQERRDGKEEEDDGEQEKRDEKEEEDDGEQERRDEKEEEDDRQQKAREEDRETDISNEEDETDSKREGPSSSPGPRRRVIRLYQYDESGQRYRHLPEPAPSEPGPAPKLKQRSLSLTRLNAIMAAASAGPMDTRETGREERPHFHMEI
ncbi:RNA polymerase-associated protein LEO1 [Centropristis striata]|uniref:RNA polymerase-associated protein LEO1 n=1 Tax=Centropristis striata TaxID=184440 RepID=UPI0027E1E54A|nr:RNA polymerase-associated protein LEO1 [Centropristis striata]